MRDKFFFSTIMSLTVATFLMLITPWVILGQIFAIADIGFVFTYGIFEKVEELSRIFKRKHNKTK